MYKKWSGYSLTGFASPVLLFVIILIVVIITYIVHYNEFAILVIFTSARQHYTIPTTVIISRLNILDINKSLTIKRIEVLPL